MNRLAAALASWLFVSPSAAALTREELQKALKQHPDLILEALKEKKRDLFFLVIEAQKEEQQRQQKEEEEREGKERAAAIKNPLKAKIDGNSHVLGKKDARHTMVIYSDFQCPYCARGVAVEKALKEKYGDALRVVFKNKPLGNHALAMPAARYFEAAALQSNEKAWELHDRLFAGQANLSEDFIKQTAQSLGLDSKRLEKDAASPEVQQRIQADIAEAEGFGIHGTPGYLIDGVPLRGAYPQPVFEELIRQVEAARPQ